LSSRRGSGAVAIFYFPSRRGSGRCSAAMDISGTAGNGRDATENTRKLEAVFWSGISRIFSGGFPQLPVLSGRILPGIIGKNPENSRPEYCFHVPGISCVFLRDPVTFPHLSWKILRDLVAGTIDLV
jgi:hypothetical protein